MEVQKKLDELQKEMDMLKLLGIKYCECQICDAPFHSEAKRIQHILQYHEKRFDEIHGNGSRDNVQPEWIS